MKMLAIAGAVMASMCSTCNAQVAPTRWHSKVDAWTFKAAVDNGVVLGFIGWINPGATVGNNLQVVWYERGAQADWSAWAWKDATRDQAIAFVRSHFSLPGLWAGDVDLYPDIDMDEAVAVDGAIPTALVDGVPVDEPIATVMAAQPNKVEFAGLLAALGWPVAPLMSQLGAASSETPCDNAAPTIDGLLNTLAHEVESTYSLAATAAACEEWCVCHSQPPIYGAWLTWTLVPSTPTAPNPTTAPNGVLVCKWVTSRTVTYLPDTGWTFGFCDECGQADPPITQYAHLTTRSTTGTCNTPTTTPVPD